jgi:DNA-binding transcriptional ArsR family regulator
MSELTEKVSDFLKILCDQTRLEILELLKNGEKSSEEIQEALNKTQSTISLQLKKLIDENIIEFEKKKEEKVSINYYRVKYDYIFKLLSNIQSFVISLQKDKVEKLLDLDKYDTLS